MDRHLMVIGFPKCATTSLFHLLQQHPDLAATATKETRVLYPAIREHRVPTAEELEALASAFPPGGRVGLEASPATVFAPAGTIAAVAERLPGLHVVAVVRNPADRFWSAFQYLQAKTVLAQDHAFEQFLRVNLDGLDRGVTYGPNPNVDFQLEAGRYARYLQPWVDVLDGRVALITSAALAADPRQVVTRLAEWVGVAPTVDDMDVTPQNVTRRPRLPRLHRLAWRVNDRGEAFFRRHPRLEDRLRSAYYRLNGRPRAGMTTEQRRRVDAVYADDMARLQALLASGQVRGPVLGPDELVASVG